MWLRSPSVLPRKGFGLYTYVSWTGAKTGSHYAATSAFRTNSLLRRCCCKPTAHCNELRETVDLLQKLPIHRKLRPALQHVAT